MRDCMIERRIADLHAPDAFIHERISAYHGIFIYWQVLRRAVDRRRRREYQIPAATPQARFKRAAWYAVMRASTGPQSCIVWESDRGVQ